MINTQESIQTNKHFNTASDCWAVYCLRKGLELSLRARFKERDGDAQPCWIDSLKLLRLGVIKSSMLSNEGIIHLQK